MMIVAMLPRAKYWDDPDDAPSHLARSPRRGAPNDACEVASISHKCRKTHGFSVVGGNIFLDNDLMGLLYVGLAT